VSAGAVGTPRILFDSGIGPSAHLTDASISVTIDNAAVGSTLQEKILGLGTFLHNRFNPKMDFTLVNSNGALQEWLNNGEGVLSAAPIPYVINENGIVMEWNTAFSPFFSDDDSQIESVCYTPQPVSVGSVRLNTTNPSGPLIIDPDWVIEDVFPVAECLKAARQIIKDSGFWAASVSPSESDYATNEALVQWILDNASGTSHFGGTCPIGGSSACLDGNFKVRCSPLFFCFLIFSTASWIF